MKALFLVSFPALFIPLIPAQTLLANNLPSCAQQCTTLLNAQSSCVPSGGAPVSNQATYQSCFCTSQLLTQLLSAQLVQLCPQCQAGDMVTIQNWYKGLCGQGAPVANNQPSTTLSSTTAPSTTTPASAPTQQGATVNGVEISNDQSAPKGPWCVSRSQSISKYLSPKGFTDTAPNRMKTHYKWIIMVIVLFVGLGLVAWIFWFLHRRYHRRREAQWSQAVGSRPDITTWGPGQSVHDLGYTPGASANIEKGKAKEQVRGVNEPPPARMRENRLSKF